MPTWERVLGFNPFGVGGEDGGMVDVGGDILCEGMLMTS